MIKTLRITSVLAAIAAAVLIYYFVIPMVVGTGGDERVDKILDEPSSHVKHTHLHVHIPRQIESNHRCASKRVRGILPQSKHLGQFHNVKRPCTLR